MKNTDFSYIIVNTESREGKWILLQSYPGRCWYITALLSIDIIVIGIIE